tara:strand:- start:77 stop:409 length:333 start_codon:yes stop_codon:yes gene_type:complete
MKTGAEWRVLEGRMRVGRNAHTAAVHGGTICAVSGIDSPDTVEVYDTSTKVWSELAGGGMSRARMFSASAVYKGKLYVLGTPRGRGMVLTSKPYTIFTFFIYEALSKSIF